MGALWRLTIFLAGLLLTSPVHAQDKQSSLHRQVSGWEVVCNNLRVCSLFGKATDSVAPVVRINVGSDRRLAPQVLIYVWAQRREPVLNFSLSAVSSAGSMQAGGLRGQANAHQFFSIALNPAQASQLLAHLRAGASLGIAPEGGKAGKPMAIPRVDGALAAAQAFTGLKRETMGFAKHHAGAARLNGKPGQDVLALAFSSCDDAEDKPDEIRQGWLMPDKSVLWEIFCASYGNGQSRIYIRQRPGKAAELMPLVHGQQTFGAEGLNGASFDPRTLSIGDGQAGGFSCGGGARRVFRWDGEVFRLYTWQRLDTCVLIDETQWPYLWQAEAP